MCLDSKETGRERREEGPGQELNLQEKEASIKVFKALRWSGVHCSCVADSRLKIRKKRLQI